MGTELVTFRDSEGLCLEAHFDDDDAGSGACGFREGPTSGRYVVSARDDGFLYAYGPVPAQTQTVRLRLGDGTRIEVSTAELPSSVARGRYFFAGLGMNVNLDSVTLLDPRGIEVEPLDF